jgi:two-component system chemotaxis response regulator CheB
MKKIKVLIVDDSAVTRKFLTESLSRSRSIEVVATALDPFIAVNKIKKFDPDVLTLDVEMPRMDGLTFLSKLMVARPMPVIMVSSFTDAGARVTMKAFELGAVDFILKPAIDTDAAWEEFSEELIARVLAASQSRVRARVPATAAQEILPDELAKYSADVIIPQKKGIQTKHHSEKVIAIGASTGGTEAIADIFRDLSEEAPGIVVVQHMPEMFTKAFADRINGIARPYVKEAEHGDRVYRGVALIAPGNRHMLLKADARGYYVEINDGLSGKPPQAFGGRPLPLHRPDRRQKRGRHPSDRHRRRRAPRDEGGGRGNDRAGRGVIRGVRHAARGNTAQRRAKGVGSEGNRPLHRRKKAPCGLLRQKLTADFV